MEDLTPEVAYVYELVWPGTDEIYIGSTSQTPEERLKGHKYKPYKCYEHLGIENAKLGFCFDYKPKHNRDRTAEKQHKKEMQARGFVVLDDGDKHGAPLRLSEEEKRKLAKAANRPETIRKKRLARGHAFTCTYPDGRVINYLSAPEAAKDLGVGHGTIVRYLKGICKPGGDKRTAHLRGCVFQYVQ